MDKKNLYITVGIFLVIVIAGIFIFTRPATKTTPPVTAASLSSLNTGPAPWQPEYTHLANRLKAINIPLLNQEGTAQHIHAHLDIFINGQTATVPADIGIYNGITPVHTHDTTGIIHIESPDAKAVYTLNQFFVIWGVKLTDTSIGGYQNNATKTLEVFDNGQKVTDPVNLDLGKHHEIVITYGTADQMPKTIPSSYNFPDGL